MHQVLARARLSPNVTRLDVSAQRIAQIRQPSQFVIVYLAENAERIPLTVADAAADRDLSRSETQQVGQHYRRRQGHDQPAGGLCRGDIVRGAATVILAMGDGKRAAKSIDEFLR